MRGSGGRVGLYRGTGRSIVVQGALGGYSDLASVIPTGRLNISDSLTGMASLVGLPIPRTPASVRCDHIRRALCALYAERSPLIHLYHRLCPVPRIGCRLLWAFRRSGVLSARRVTRSVAGSVDRTAVPLARPDRSLPQ